MRLPRDVSGMVLQKSLRRLGYEAVRQRGSHVRVTTQVNGEHHEVIPQHNLDKGEDAVEHLEERRAASRNECGRTPRRVGTMSASHPIGGFKPYSVDRPQPLRSLEEIRSDILDLERETERL